MSGERKHKKNDKKKMGMKKIPSLKRQGNRQSKHQLAQLHSPTKPIHPIFTKATIQ